MADININTTTNQLEADGSSSLTIDPAGTETVTINNGLLVPDGTKSAPALRFADDGNTGIYSKANEEISLTGNGEDVLHTVGVASAVNNVKITNAATGNPILLEAEGTDANVGITVTPKGTGAIVLDGLSWPTADGTADYVLKTDGSGSLGFVAQTAASLPVADTTALVKGSADATKLVRIEADGITTGTTRVITMPDNNVDLGTDFATAAQGTTADNALAKAGGTMTGDLVMSGASIKEVKGADVASATALPLITDGNYFDVTGTTTVTSFASVGVGTTVKLHFDGILTLTHSATDLVLPGAANITTAAGDEFTFVEYAAGDYRCISYALASGESVVSGGGGATGYHYSGTITTVPVGTGEDTLVIGDGASALTATGSVCIGKDASAKSNDCVSIGRNARADAGDTSSVSIGVSSRCTNTSGIAIGNTALSAAADGIAIGRSTYAAGVGSMAFGKGATPLTGGSVIFFDALTNAKGAFAFRPESNLFHFPSARGAAQWVNYLAYAETTNATQTELFVANSSSRIVLPSDTTWAFTIMVVARRTDADGESASYKYEGCIDNNAGTVALVGSVTETIIAEDTAAWSVTVDADDTNNALRLQATGEASKTIRWLARIETVEIAG